MGLNPRVATQRMFRFRHRQPGDEWPGYHHQVATRPARIPGLPDGTHRPTTVVRFLSSLVLRTNLILGLADGYQPNAIYFGVVMVVLGSETAQAVRFFPGKTATHRRARAQPLPK